MVQHAARELYTWNKCSHPNIMPLLGLAVFRDRIGMVAPWMENGTLRSYYLSDKPFDSTLMASRILV